MVVPTSAVKSVAEYSIVEPFLAIVRLLAPQLNPSVITIELPSEGVAGKVTVNDPAAVLAMYWLPEANCVFEVRYCHGVKVPVAPVAPPTPVAPVAPISPVDEPTHTPDELMTGVVPTVSPFLTTKLDDVAKIHVSSCYSYSIFM